MVRAARTAAAGIDAINKVFGKFLLEKPPDLRTIVNAAKANLSASLADHVHVDVGDGFFDGISGMVGIIL